MKIKVGSDVTAVKDGGGSLTMGKRYVVATADNQAGLVGVINDYNNIASYGYDCFVKVKLKLPHVGDFVIARRKVDGQLTIGKKYEVSGVYPYSKTIAVMDDTGVYAMAKRKWFVPAVVDTAPVLREEPAEEVSPYTSEYVYVRYMMRRSQYELTSLIVYGHINQWQDETLKNGVHIISASNTGDDGKTIRFVFDEHGKFMHFGIA